MELGRECLEIWGYKRVDELIWVKTNQLQRLIRTGRTGHWLNQCVALQSMQRHICQLSIGFVCAAVHGRCSCVACRQ